MQCISPMSVQRPNGRGSRDRITVPCGKCPSCLANKRASWAFRLKQELKDSKSAKFITLTYDDKHNTGSLSKIDVQLFLKRFRALCKKVDEGYQVRYYLTGEYGSNTFRPHYHMLVFNVPVYDEMKLYELINKSWKNGSSFIGDVTPASIMYVAKYLLKGSVTPDGCEEPFSLMSRRPGIGFQYVERMSDWHAEEQRTFVQSGSVKQTMPRYYKDKIFSKTDKEEISIKNQVKMDEEDNQRLYETFAKGIHPFENELLKKQDSIRKMEILTKKGKL